MESRGRDTVAAHTQEISQEGLGQWEKHLKNKGKWKEKGLDISEREKWTERSPINKRLGRVGAKIRKLVM